MKKKLMITLLIVSLTGGSVIAGYSAVQKAAERKAAEEAAAREAEANDCYEKGRAALYGLDGTEISYETAFQNFEKAKELGKADADFYLGILCDWYSYPKQDYAAAKTYYEACGENPYAKIALGFLYYNAQGVEEDKKKAEELFQAAVDQGCADGYLGLAVAARDKEDYETALEYYNKAVEEGTEQVYTACAMGGIGYLYYSGDGAAKDYAKAMECFEKSVDLGYNSAMYMIGVLYYNGYGVERDYEKALEWLDKAAALGDEAAKENAEYVRQRMQ